jgi:hypothetical protein
MPYREFPVREYTNEVIGGIANGAVTEYCFGDYDAAGDIAIITSGWGGIVMTDASDNTEVSLKTGGIFRLMVNGNSANIAKWDPLKPTTNGYGIVADTDGDKYSAISLEPSTTDADCILVIIEHGYMWVAQE